MMKHSPSRPLFCVLVAVVLSFLPCIAASGRGGAVVQRNPAAITGLLNRIGGKGASQRFETAYCTDLFPNGQEGFRISTKSGKPYIQGSSYSALTAGINWYLNHYAHVNLSWNCLTTDLSQVSFPLPAMPEVHTCNAGYRYYLNYCTFCYSMSAWTWERWEQEIDWMALHGVNMPLQIIGLESVWRSFLMEDCGYSETEAEAFVPGPAYTAWWAMNNLQGWGGDGPDQSRGVTNDAWYRRQKELARKILARERELGMDPVLPGFSGMMPVGHPGAESQGSWCGFTRPYMLDPTTSFFQTCAAKYYAQLAKVMGTSRYYSMDPFHEGGVIRSGAYADGYRAVYEAMNVNCGSDTKWVIQQWQWSAAQASSLHAVPSGRLIVLDLFSDGKPSFDTYQGYAPQEAVYCVIPNFGGRTGFFGRIPKMVANYYAYKDKYTTVRGIGAAPEAIEQTPVVYDLLYELPWMDSLPSTSAWMQHYALSRYGTDASDVWDLLCLSILNDTTALQGPHEAVVCARPSLTVDRVSSWGGTTLFYDPSLVVDAAYRLWKLGRPNTAVGVSNYCYDICDLTRQALTDYAQRLLVSLREAHGEEFVTCRDSFLQLILDMDTLLGTHQMFRLGRWTEMARRAAMEVDGATSETADWLERTNARQLITTWGGREQSERGGLHDYSYRQWQGMLRDFYYPRWKWWFAHEMTVPPEGWFPKEWAWAHDSSRYSEQPAGDTYTIVGQLLHNYFDKGNNNNKTN